MMDYNQHFRRALHFASDHLDELLVCLKLVWWSDCSCFLTCWTGWLQLGSALTLIWISVYFQLYDKSFPPVDRKSSPPFLLLILYFVNIQQLNFPLVLAIVVL